MMTRRTRTLAAWSTCAILAFALTGCARQESHDPAPSAGDGVASRLAAPVWRPPSLERPEGDAFWRLPYPLAVGNQWKYDVDLQYTLFTSEGPRPPGEYHSVLDVAITGVVPVGSRTYFQQSESDPALGAPPSIFLVRQDRGGLFGFDGPYATSPANSTPPDADPFGAAAARDYVDRTLAGSPRHAAFQRAALALAARLEQLRHGALREALPLAGGPDAGEISLLRYPLHVGAGWIVRDSPRFSRVVVAREPLRVPAGLFTAWRLRGESELYGSGDRVRFWYSGAGLLRISVHSEMDAVDDQGNIIGRFVADQEQVLRSYSFDNPVVGPLEPQFNPTAGRE